VYYTGASAEKQKESKFQQAEEQLLLHVVDLLSSQLVFKTLIGNEGVDYLTLIKAERMTIRAA